jgi:hypothetical protein
MIPAKLKSLIYSNRIRGMLNKNVTSAGIRSEKIGLIIDAEDRKALSVLANLYKEAGIAKENFRIVLCGEAEDLPEGIVAAALKPREVSVTGEFKSVEIQKFAQEEFNYLVSFLPGKSQVGSLLTAVCHARIKFGNCPDDYGIYDVEINALKAEVFQRELIKYFKILKRD